MDSLVKFIFSIIGTVGLIATLGGCVYALVNPRIRAVVKVAWKAAFRFRVFWVMAVLLVVSVGVIPLIVKGDGTAEGLTQVLVTYTLTMITAVLATGVLWLSVGTLARDIEDSQIQMIVVKPISRWQIILGKWVGVMSLNLLLLSLGGVVVFGLVEYRANKLTWDRLEELEPRSNLEILQVAMETGVQIFELDEDPQGRVVGVRPTDKEQPLLTELINSAIQTELPGLVNQFRINNDGSSPLLKNFSDVRETVASDQEKVLRNSMLVGRANMNLEDVLYSVTPVRNLPLEEKYSDEIEYLFQKMKEEAVAQKIDMIEANGGRANESDLKLALREEEVFRNRARLIHRVYAQVMKPETGFLFRFKKPFAYNGTSKDPLQLQFKIENPAVGYTSDVKYPLHVLLVPGEVPDIAGRGPNINRAYELQAKIEQKIMLPSVVSKVDGDQSRVQSVFEDADHMNVIIRNPIPNLTNNISSASLKIQFLDENTGEIEKESVQLLYKESGFALNFSRSLGVIFAWLGVLCALGLFASTFMSFSMAAFACIGLLVVSSNGATVLMEDVIKDETIMQTYTEAERDKSIVDWYALPAFKLLVGLTSPLKDFSPIKNVATGRSTTWSELMRAYFYNWGCAVFMLGIAGAVVFSRRQLALADNNT